MCIILYIPVIRLETLLHINIIILYYTCAQLNKPTELIKLYNSIIMIAYVYKEKKNRFDCYGRGNCDINLHVHQEQTREFVEL